MAQSQIEPGALSRELAQVRFSHLYRTQAQAILAYTLRRTGDDEDAADVVAETFWSLGGDWAKSRSTTRPDYGSMEWRGGCSPISIEPSGGEPSWDSAWPSRFGPSSQPTQGRAGRRRRFCEL
jgi:hypothetical protein